MRASLLIQGQISYFFIGQGGLVRFSYVEKLLNPKIEWKSKVQRPNIICTLKNSEKVKYSARNSSVLYSRTKLPAKGYLIQIF
ncbi:hypothetical protein EJN90_10530 [Jeotgalibaca ciconiae]|uniref:Uncharacterized protein n=1 Tax=Jeotgalibaca ciconiae TaxID=2496265 RepID=A0A3S9HCC6_9LACT|nr:hypothetical protein EJN90_10530 [Jeotgalibaca ciconiae]